MITPVTATLNINGENVNVTITEVEVNGSSIYITYFDGNDNTVKVIRVKRILGKVATTIATSASIV